MKRRLGLLLGVVAFMGLFYFLQSPQSNSLPLIAVANYGPHPSLDLTIQGLKETLAAQGFIENKTVRFEVKNVGFDPALIPQMVNQLASEHPKAMVVMTTPVAQYAKHVVHDIPLIYSVVTDPVQAGLLRKTDQPDGNMTGSSDQQNLTLFLKFAKRLLPSAKRVGLLYSTSEANDVALLKLMQTAAQEEGMQVVALPITQARDVALAMPRFKGLVDLIYVGASGPVQPTLPAIASSANMMHIPVFNVDASAVKANQVLASYGVDYRQVGKNTADLVVQLLKGKPMRELQPRYPTLNTYQGLISRARAYALGVSLPDRLPPHVKVVE